jgi:hypothetical protein
VIRHTQSHSRDIFTTAAFLSDMEEAAEAIRELDHPAAADQR